MAQVSHNRSDDSVVPVAKVLTARIDDHLLRGSPITNVLCGFGEVFHSTTGTMSVDRSDFDKSKPIKRLDDFISHSWAASRWSKFLGLTLVYNSRAALIAGHVAGIWLMILQFDSVGVLPKPPATKFLLGGLTWESTRGVWCTLFGSIAFLVILLFWQSIRFLFKLKQSYVFLDKLCVNQEEEDQKVAAVLSLGGFLCHSDRIVVCWTPEYFTRLWCTYEIASWLHLGKPLQGVLFVPLQLCMVLFATYVCTQCFMFGLLVYGYVEQSSPNVFIGIVMLLSLLLYMPLAHNGRYFSQVLQQLPAQIDRFSMNDVKCFCCSNEHRLPGTDVRLPCDRKLVLRTISSWFRKSAFESETEAQSRFEQMVRGRFGNWVLHNVGPARLPYRWALIVSIPNFLRACDVFAGAESFPRWDLVLRCVCQHMVMGFAIFPSSARLLLHTLVYSNKLIGFPTSPFCNLLVSFSVGCSAWFCIMIQWVPLQLFNLWSNPIPMLIWSALCLALLISLFPELRSCFCLRLLDSGTESEVTGDVGESASACREVGARDAALEAAASSLGKRELETTPRT